MLFIFFAINEQLRKFYKFTEALFNINANTFGKVHGSSVNISISYCQWQRKISELKTRAFQSTIKITFTLPQDARQKSSLNFE